MQPKFKLVVGIDFEQTGEEALRLATTLSQAISESELHLTYVIADSSATPKASIAEYERKLTAGAERLTQYVAAHSVESDNPFSRPVVQHVRIGEPAGSLQQVAVDVQANLIVVGSRGQTGLSKWVFGSVSEALVRLARCPVIIAKPNELASLPQTPRPEAADAGLTEKDLHARPALTRNTIVTFGRTTHISGGI